MNCHVFYHGCIGEMHEYPDNRCFYLNTLEAEIADSLQKLVLSCRQMSHDSEEDEHQLEFHRSDWLHSQTGLAVAGNLQTNLSKFFQEMSLFFRM